MPFSFSFFLFLGVTHGMAFRLSFHKDITGFQLMQDNTSLRRETFFYISPQRRVIAFGHSHSKY
jgi:hypothetical protein